MSPIDRLRGALGADTPLREVASRDSLPCVQVEPGHVRGVLEALRTSCGFDTNTFVTAIDRSPAEPRFEVTWQFLSLEHRDRVRVRTRVADGEHVPSCSDLWPGASFSERECFDMFGVVFDGHPDLRRILTDYGFRGHPLRKDFPTTGYTEVRYDETSKRVVYEPVSLVQEYRQFDFMSPWEGADYILPGDEKEA